VERADSVVTAGSTLLVVDIGQELAGQLGAALPDMRLLVAGGRADAVPLLRQHKPPVALLGLRGGDGRRGTASGLALLGTVLEAEPATKAVVLTEAPADRELTLAAVGLGAWEVLDPPIALESLRFVIARAAALSELEREHRRRLLAPGHSPLPGVLGASPAMLSLCRQVERVAPTDASVVFTGENGTGKEVMARALHAASPRRNRRFVAINCAAIPDTLLESELFGYERGAFTGAVKLTPGRIELADSGTLFLDEIGDLPLGLQGKLLRFLQERVIERIGGRREIAVDVRVVCATHRDLAGLIGTGGFREDLYYRLTEIALHLPPLRERNGDAILLARHFLAQYAAPAAQPLRGFAAAALHAIDAHGWPGNVRELQNRVKRAVIMATGPRILPVDLDLPEVADSPRDLDLRRCRDAVEQSVLRRAVARSDGNLASAARLIGVSRPTLYDLLRHHGMRD
jgi:two-component system, NtrC family, response regulator